MECSQLTRLTRQRAQSPEPERINRTKERHEPHLMKTAQQNTLSDIDHSAESIAAATAQIELAMREAEFPIEQLGHSIRRLAMLVGNISVPPELKEDGNANDDLARVQADMSKAIEHLQFYDRLVQHLSHVRDYLSAISRKMAETSDQPLDDEAWVSLRAQLRKRLISDAQRDLLDLILPVHGKKSDDPNSENREHSAAQGSIELF